MKQRGARRASDAEIVDALLGRAEKDVEARVRETVESDPHAREVHEKWEASLPAMTGPLGGLKDLSARVQSAVATELRETEIARPSSSEVVLKLANPPDRWIAWKRAGVVLALIGAIAGAAALIVLVPG